MFIVKVPDSRFEWVTDMLRYDGCFDYERVEGGWKFSLLNFTKARWESFGYVPESVVEIHSSAAERRQNESNAIGFTRGVRFAQLVFGKTLVEDFNRPQIGLPQRRRE